MKKHAAILFVLITFASCGIFDSNSDYDLGDSKIVLALKNDSGNYQLYSMKSNGDKLHRIIGFNGHDASQPSWSPDGKQIAFTSTYKATTAGHSIFIVNSDGTSLRPMQENDSGVITPGSHPNWSPDGSRIAFDYCSNCELGGANHDIYIYDFDTNSISQITDHPHSDSNPVWSPDGNYIAFNSTRDTSSSIADDIYLLDLSTNDIERITNSGNAGRYHWLNDNNTLLYWSDNLLYLLDLTTRETEQISVPISQNVGFRPWGASRDGSKVLLHIFNYSNPNSSQTVQMLDRNTGELELLASDSQYSTGSWIILH